jgi:hypothetical protein
VTNFGGTTCEGGEVCVLSLQSCRYGSLPPLPLPPLTQVSTVSLSPPPTLPSYADMPPSCNPLPHRHHNLPPQVSVVSALLAYKCGPAFAAVTLGTIGLYSAFTFGVTRWRTNIRRQQNQAESQMNHRFAIRLG